MSKFTCPECCLSVGHAPGCVAGTKPDLVLPTPDALAAAHYRQVNGADAPAVDAHAEPAPESSLPNWSECSRIIENHEFRQRAAAGLEGQVLDTPAGPEPTELHRFIYEYDDADAYRSAWFMHRLERVIAEVKAAPASPASAPEASELVFLLRQLSEAYPEDIWPPLSESERNLMGSLLDRASAGMGRHFSAIFKAAADALEDAAPLPPIVARKELSKEEVFAIRETIKPGDGWDGDDWDLNLARAIERHLMGESK